VSLDCTTFTYDAAGRRTLREKPTGARSSYTYDPADSLTQEFHLKPNGEVSSAFVYTVDATKHRTAVAESSGERATCTYDATYQLTNERRSGANAYNTTFVYDAAGNRIVKITDGTLTTTTYDVANQISDHAMINYGTSETFPTISG